MNFRDEYKKEITELSTDETARRIRESVMARLEKSEQSEPTVPEAPVKKKPLPIKRIAVVGGSIAACLVIGFTALAVNSKLPGYIFSVDMAPNENMAGNPGLSGGAGGMNKPQDIQGGDNITDAGENSTEQENGESWSNTVSDGGNIGGNTGRDPTNNAPESVPPTDSSSTENDSDPIFTAGGALVITFEDDGIMLSDDNGTHFFPAAVGEYDEYGGALTEDELQDFTEAYTADGERYTVMQKNDRLVLLTDELEIVGIYVIF